MKYYKDTEGNLYADPANTEGLEEVLSPARDDGSILPQHEAIGQLTLQEDGTRYSTYLTEPDEDGVYQPDDEAISEAELEQEKVELKEQQTQEKIEGVEIFGVMCSATKEDMWGLVSTKEWILAGNSTTFDFDNGNQLELTTENYADFYAIWAPFRSSFFE